MKFVFKKILCGLVLDCESDIWLYMKRNTMVARLIMRLGSFQTVQIEHWGRLVYIMHKVVLSLQFVLSMKS